MYVHTRPAAPRRHFYGQSMPLVALLPYLVVGFVLFLAAPFSWNPPNLTWLSLYFLAILVVLSVGFLWPANAARIPPQSPLRYQYFIVAGTLLAVALLIPAVQLYSGKYPWQFGELLANQTEAYNTYQERLRYSTQADRAPVAIMRTLAHPIVFSALPLVVLHWRNLNWLYRACGAIVVLCLLIVSLARGTDRETFDILVFLSAGWLVAHFRERNHAGSAKRRLALGRKVTVFASLFALLAVAFFLFFVDRKLGRYGGEIDRLCIGFDQQICLLNTAFGSGWLGDWGVFALGVTASYMSQGYYGLSLAMSLDFQSTWGTGWSPLAARLYEMISGDTTRYALSYTFRMRAMGWSDEFSWSTLMVWFANDVGFLGALGILAFFAAMMGAAWRDAVLGRDDRAAIVFVLLFLMFVYLPANNQIGQTLDLTFAFWVWVLAWRLLRIRYTWRSRSPSQTPFYVHQMPQRR